MHTSEINTQRIQASRHEISISNHARERKREGEKGREREREREREKEREKVRERDGGEKREHNKH